MNEIIKNTAEPGSPEWHARRQKSFNASDVGAAMGCDPNKTRTQLLQELHTGIRQDFSDYVQSRVVNPGHRIEALARPIAEEIIGDDLQVVGASRDFDLSRPLGASMDGITFLEDPAWECKRANAELRAALPHAGRDSAEKNDPAAIPKAKRAQMAQQQLVFGHKRTLFTVADFDAHGNVTEERHCWYDAEPDLHREVLATWKQIDADLVGYTPPAASAVEKIIAEPVEALPAPVVKVTGQIALVDNFKAFEERLREFLADKLIREPKTDEDFVNLDGQIRAMKNAREALKAAEAQMLAQVQPVDQAKKTKDMLDSLLQQNVSMAEKLLTAEKERRKGEIVAVGIKGLTDHIAALNLRLGKPYMPAIPADFGGVIKGLKSLASMEDKVATELARAKIAANEVADRLQINLEYLRANAADYTFLFADTAQIIGKAPDDLQALVQNRIAAHKTEEQRKLEAERERIRAEEAARVEREARERAAAEETRIREESAAQERQRLLAEQAAQAAETPAPTPAQKPQFTAVTRPVTVNPEPTVANDIARMKLGDINVRIAPMSITADGLAELGFEPVSTERNSKLYRTSDWPAICEALIQRLLQAKSLQVA